MISVHDGSRRTGFSSQLPGEKEMYIGLPVSHPASFCRFFRERLMMLLLVWVCPQAVDAQANPTGSASRSFATYTGRWDLTIEVPTGARPSWIELSENEGRLEGLMVGLAGHAIPTGEVQIKDGGIEFSPPEDEGFPDGTLFRGRLADGELVGTATTLNGASWRWTGRRAPALAPKSTPRWGAPIRLFDGKDLAGWTFLDPNRTSNWRVEDGTLVKHGRASEIVTTSKFRDFKLHVEFNCGPMANSGVYLRGRYELQIETDSAGEPPNRRMGAVYGFIAPHTKRLAKLRHHAGGANRHGSPRRPHRHRPPRDSGDYRRCF
jgi:Domain of Unknown Function (DUF1080)